MEKSLKKWIKVTSFLIVIISSVIGYYKFVYTSESEELNQLLIVLEEYSLDLIDIKYEPYKVHGEEELQTEWFATVGKIQYDGEIKNCRKIPLKHKHPILKTIKKDWPEHYSDEDGSHHFLFSNSIRKDSGLWWDTSAPIWRLDDAIKQINIIKKDGKEHGEDILKNVAKTFSKLLEESLK